MEKKLQKIYLTYYSLKNCYYGKNHGKLIIKSCNNLSEGTHRIKDTIKPSQLFIFTNVIWCSRLQL